MVHVSRNDVCRFDTIVIGASVAGSVAAHQLGSGGAAVALVDKAQRTGRKPCGEGLSNRGLTALTRMGLWFPDQVPHLPYEGITIATRSKVRHVSDPAHRGVTISRRALDESLRLAACAVPSVTPRFGEVVEAIARDASGEWRVQTSRSTLMAPRVVIADGSGSRCASMIGATSRTLGKPVVGARVIYRGTFAPRPQRSVVIVSFDGHEVYATPLPEGELNVTVLTRFPSPRAITSLLTEAVLREVFTLVGFEGVEVEPLQGRAPVGYRRRYSHEEGVFLIGDAAEEFDPVGGMGMTHAILSAGEAARQIISELRGYGAMAPSLSSVHPLRRETRIAATVVRLAPRAPWILDLAALPAAQWVYQCVCGERGV